jgi:hypothetical protein
VSAEIIQFVPRRRGRPSDETPVAFRSPWRVDDLAMDHAVVDRAMATVLASFGIEEEDRRELRADFQHLRRWRKSVEQAQGFTFKAVISIIVAGFLGAVWLGIKATLGK